MNKLVLTTQDATVKTATQLFAQANNLELEVTDNVVVAFPTLQKPQSLQELEVVAIRQAIAYHKGNLSEAAKTLGVGRATLYRKIKEYDVNVKEIKTAA